MKTPSSKAAEEQEPTWREPASLPSEREGGDEETEATDEGTTEEAPDTDEGTAYSRR